MMNKFIFAGATLLSALGALARPEVSWSVMHPSSLDVDYMRRVVEKADEYGGVDSFEVCGACHVPGQAGIDGLCTFDRYSRAHAKVDLEAVRKTRDDLNAIAALAHSGGRRLYFWHREIFLPAGLLEDLPGMMDANGELDVLGTAYHDYLSSKIGEAFDACPGLDGIVLTLTESDYSVLHNSDQVRYPAERVVEALVGIFAAEHEKRGKTFILRSFGDHDDYISIIAGAKRAADRHAFEIETKVTEGDFVPWLPNNEFLVRTPPLTLGAECDALGEYLGAGFLPAAQVSRIREYVEASRKAGVSRYAIRIDRIRNSIFDSAHEVNLYAYMRFIDDPAATADGVIAEYAAKRFGKAAETMAPLIKDELEMIRGINYIASNLTFHPFPIPGKFEWAKTGGALSLFRENRDLKSVKDIWSILSWHRTPTHAQILSEKEAALRIAREGLATVERCRDALGAAEYSRQRRAFGNAVQAATAMDGFAKCAVAYFEDMDARADEPLRLKSAVDAAVAAIDAVKGGEMDHAYLNGLREICRQFPGEYALERPMRKALEAREDVIDFVIPGGVYDDNRFGRVIYAAMPESREGRVVCLAGNSRLPDGKITVRLNGPADAEVVVDLDSEGARQCEVRKDFSGGVWTVVVGKKGREYPAVRSIALVRRPR